MAWLIEFLALLLGLLCIVESSNSNLASGKLLGWERMPSTLFAVVLAVVFRCVAMGCIYNCAWPAPAAAAAAAAPAALPRRRSPHPLPPPCPPPLHLASRAEHAPLEPLQQRQRL